MKKILAIGNSFSEDATAYLHEIALCGGIDTKIVNLYIGGCSLKTHCENIKNDAPNYEYQLNGIVSDTKSSIKDALLQEDWDYVTLQQASHDSGIIETYKPYFSELLDYVKKYAPTCKVLIHQTWAYDTNSTHGSFPLYDCNQIKMYNALKNAYEAMSQEYGLDIIPSGELIQKLRDLNKMNLTRDGFHLSFDYGRYAVAALWFVKLLNGSLSENSFLPPCVPPEEKIDLEAIALIKKSIINIAN